MYRRVLSAMACLFAAAALTLTAGCYTQLSVVDRTPPEAREYSDSLARQVDTVSVKEREVCYWTRDIFGDPVLRCSHTYYSRDWYLYSNAPWWYRYGSYWYDYDRCPRYYYYDAGCGCCKYYLERSCYDCDPPYYWNGGGGGGSSHAAPAHPRTRSPGVPSGGTVPSSGAAGQLKQPEPAAKTPAPVDDGAAEPRRTRSPAVPAATPESPAVSKPLDKSGASGGSLEQPTVPAAAPQATTPDNGEEKSSQDDDKSQDKRRNPRSW